MTHHSSYRRSRLLRKSSGIRNFILDDKHFPLFVKIAIDVLEESEKAAYERAPYPGERKQKMADALRSLEISEEIRREWAILFDKYDENERTEIYAIIAELFLDHEKEFRKRARQYLTIQLDFKLKKFQKKIRKFIGG